MIELAGISWTEQGREGPENPHSIAAAKVESAMRPSVSSWHVPTKNSNYSSAVGSRPEMTDPLLPCMSAFWALRDVAADDAQGSDSRSRLEVTSLVSKRYSRLLADIGSQ